ANRYIHAIIVLGALLLPYCLYRVIGDLNAANLATELLQMGCLVAICAVCRSLPIYITPHHAIDVSILAIITAVLLRGPYQAVIVYLLSSLCSVDLETGGEKKAHLYNTPIKKSAFNNANLLLSILIPGLLIQACGHVAGDVHLPWVLVPMVLFTVTSFLMNSAILFGMFYLNGDITGQDAREAVKGLIPNVIAAMPMGLLTCYVFTQEGGYWVALIMLLPLMLARHAWKLYLDSQNQHLSLIQAFVATVEAKDKYTEGHSRRVSKYAEMIAAQMGLSPSEIQDIRVAALLHDIGKIGVPDAVLLKPEKLTDEEYARIKEHPKTGVRILGQVQFPAQVMDMIGHHHERVDGKGYPDGLAGEELSIGARIMAVADAYDAMTSERPYRKGMAHSLAVAQLLAGKGTQFDPDVVEALLAAQRAEKGKGAGTGADNGKGEGAGA
ncbi:MAG: HD-GYP domain-containing protein, partial [Clostridia bacterium]